MIPHSSTCVLCYTAFESNTSYGLCPHCWSRDRLREFDRLETALHSARRHGYKASLQLHEWMSIIGDFNGYCAFCLVEPLDRLEVICREQGVIVGNVVPICRSCYVHRQDGWEAAVIRVQRYLSGEEGDLSAKRFPVFAEREEEEVEA